MLDLQNRQVEPSLSEISGYIQNPLFDALCAYMNEKYQALRKIEYSKDVWFPGWNVKFRKAGKGLCVVYPKMGCFAMLVVVGNRERERVERLLPQFSAEFQKIYAQTREGMGQRWLMLDLDTDDRLYRDALRIIQIRRAGQ